MGRFYIAMSQITTTNISSAIDIYHHLSIHSTSRNLHLSPVCGKSWARTIPFPIQTCIFIIGYTLGASISQILQGPRGHIAVGTELLGSPFQCQAVLAHGTFNDPPFIPATSSSGKGEHTQETYKNMSNISHHIFTYPQILGKGNTKGRWSGRGSKKRTGVQTATVQVRPKSVLLCVQVSLRKSLCMYQQEHARIKAALCQGYCAQCCLSVEEGRHGRHAMYRMLKGNPKKGKQLIILVSSISVHYLEGTWQGTKKNKLKCMFDCFFGGGGEENIFV